MLEPESLFRIYDNGPEQLNNAYHLAAMAALLGPSPPELIQKSKEASKVLEY